MTQRNVEQHPVENAGQPPLSHLYLSLTQGNSSDYLRSWHTAQLQANRSGAGSLSPENARQGQNVLPLETIRQVIGEAVPLGLRSVRLGGEEPILHPDIEALLSLLESLALAATVEITGSGLTPEHAAQMARMSRCSAEIVLYGADPATHDALHGKHGSFDAALLAARLLVNAGLPPQVLFAVTRNSAAQLPRMVRLAEDMGAESLRIVYPRPHDLNGRKKGSGMLKDSVPNRALSVEELIALGRKVEREYACKTRLRLIFNQPPVFRGLSPLARVDGQGGCEAFGTLGVLASGAYALCSNEYGMAEKPPELLLGTAGVDLLACIWREHPTLLTLRAGLPDRLEGICQHCIMKKACMGYCAEENYRVSGAFWGPFWFCAAAERAGLFPAGRLIENHW